MLNKVMLIRRSRMRCVDPASISLARIPVGAMATELCDRLY